MRFGVAGAGIGGLAAAALLARAGHTVEVFDQFDAPKPVGSGLVMQPVGLEVLDAIGAGDAARALGEPLLAMFGDEADHQRVVLKVSYGARADRQGLAIHRAALHHVLLAAAQDAGVTLIPSRSVLGRDGQCLCFDDGSRAGPFDLILDACGAGSPLSPLQARPLPYGAVWATVPWPDAADLPRGRLSQRYRRADRMLGILPVGAMPAAPDVPMAAVFYSLRTDEIEPWRARAFDDWRAEAEALWPEIAPFLPDGMEHSDFTFASYTHGSLLRPYSDGLVHLGDAWHRASPQLGQGANMALLDAWALTCALDRTGRLTEDTLRIYAAARRWHIWAYQLMSAAFTPQYQSDSVILPVVRDRVLAPLAQVWPVTSILTRLVCGDLLPPMAQLTPRR